MLRAAVALPAGTSDGAAPGEQRAAGDSQAPLTPPFSQVEVVRTVEGWVGGLGVGLTHRAPQELLAAGLPARASQVPGAFVVGYHGGVFLGGAEQPAAWQPDSLREGQRVGVLLTAGERRDLLVLVDGERALRVDGESLKAAGLRRAPLYAVVDVVNATSAVRLVERSSPPPRELWSAASPRDW
ncbi:unnamed protein product, partial [Prorocentrum cordatum]